MWQLTQSRSNNNNYLNTNNSRNNFRQFGRRLSYNIYKVLRKWRNSESNDIYNMNEVSKVIQNAQIHNSIDDILQVTDFTKEEIQYIYRDFKQKCPNGYLTQESLSDIYSQFFPLGDCRQYSRHLFSAILSNNSDIDESNNNEKKISFKDFIVALSNITKGSVEDKTKWLFNLYDLNKDGRISRDEIKSMVYSLYDLMGNGVHPSVDETTKQNHIEYAIDKLGVNYKGYLDYNEFHQMLMMDEDLMNALINSF